MFFSIDNTGKYPSVLLSSGTMPNPDSTFFLTDRLIFLPFRVISPAVGFSIPYMHFISSVLPEPTSPPIPVSYTHLDVYKRQQFNCICKLVNAFLKRTARLFAVNNLFSHNLKPPVFWKLLYDCENITLFNDDVPVSYTHLFPTSIAPNKIASWQQNVHTYESEKTTVSAIFFLPIVALNYLYI